MEAARHDIETTIFVYDAGGQLIAEYSTQTAQTPQVSYLTTDHLGSPRVITDHNGDVSNRKDYTAFGEVNYTAHRAAGLGYAVNAEETRKGYTGCLINHFHQASPRIKRIFVDIAASGVLNPLAKKFRQHLLINII
mgnify:CR=1 FL=1